MSKQVHVHSPEVRAMAKKIFPNASNPSVNQQTIALFFIRLNEDYPDGAECALYTLPALAAIYRPGYSSLPLSEKKAAQETVRKMLRVFATASAQLPLVIVPVPEKAWDLQENGNYPPSTWDADALYRGQWKIYGAHVGMMLDGSIPTAYTASNRRKGKGVLDAQTQREEGWTVHGMISDAVCEERGMRTQKQLAGEQPLLTK